MGNEVIWGVARVIVRVEGGGCLIVCRRLTRRVRRNGCPTESVLPSRRRLARVCSASERAVQGTLGLLTRGNFVRGVHKGNSLILSLGGLRFPVSNLIDFGRLTKGVNRHTRAVISRFSLVRPSTRGVGRLRVSGDRGM